MAGINIDFPAVKQKTSELKQLIETELEGNTLASYETALRYAGELQGAGAEAIREAVARGKGKHPETKPLYDRDAGIYPGLCRRL